MLDLCHKVVAERIARLEAMVDEQLLVVVIRTGVQVVAESRA